MARRVAADRAVRGKIMLAGGVARLLATIVPGVVWAPPVLVWRCPYSSGPSVDLHPDGRGLRVVPTCFWFPDTPGWSDRPGEPLELVSRARHEMPRTSAGLSVVLGATRAAVLAAADGGATTTHLASRVSISVAGASQRASALRAAGLVASARHGRTVVHTLTPLGAAMSTRASAR